MTSVNQIENNKIIYSLFLCGVVSGVYGINSSLSGVSQQIVLVSVCNIVFTFLLFFYEKRQFDYKLITSRSLGYLIAAITPAIPILLMLIIKYSDRIGAKETDYFWFSTMVVTGNCLLASIFSPIIVFILSLGKKITYPLPVKIFPTALCLLFAITNFFIFVLAI